jgi:hypothetical protein
MAVVLLRKIGDLEQIVFELVILRALKFEVMSN